MGAPTKRARKIRTAAEFDPAILEAALRTPTGSGVPLTSWTLEQIFSARDSQLRGDFRTPARMAESMRTDDALAVALENRLAPLRCIKVAIEPAKGARAVSIANEADALFGQCGVAITSDTIASIAACLANHDVAFGQNVWTPRADGSRIDVEHHIWPIEHVRWDNLDRCFKARIEITPSTPAVYQLSEVPIVHGDGRWVIYQRYEQDPFKHGAILAAAIVWARHAYAIRDWSKGSVAHGSAKVIGEMPAGVPLQATDGDGNTVLSDEAAAMGVLLQAIATSDTAVGLRPAGSKTEFLTNSSTAWQVWAELVLNAERAAARIYLGTDGILGTTGGAPGVDVESLFGVAATKVEGDIACLRRGIETGIIEPWTALNFGDSTLSPKRKYLLPDKDEDASRAARAVRKTAFFDEIERAKNLGFAITQEVVDVLAEKHGVDTMLLAVAPAAAPVAPAAPSNPAAAPAAAPEPAQ